MAISFDIDSSFEALHDLIGNFTARHQLLDLLGHNAPSPFRNGMGLPPVVPVALDRITLASSHQPPTGDHPKDNGDDSYEESPVAPLCEKSPDLGLHDWPPTKSVAAVKSRACISTDLTCSPRRGRCCGTS